MSRTVDEKERLKFIRSHPHLFNNAERNSIRLAMLERKVDKFIKKVKEENEKKNKSDRRKCDAT